MRQATDVTYSNDSALRTQGVDVQFDWRTSVGPGNLSLNFLANYLLKNETRVDPESPWIDWAGSFGPTGISGVQGGSFDYRTFTTVNYFQNNWNMALRWRHLPDVMAAVRVTTPTDTTRNPGRYDMFDLNGGYSFGNNYSLRFGIDNLFDKKPPVTNANEFQNGNNTNSGFYDVLGRRFFLGLQMSF